jgi:hypothetical protein
MGGLGPKSLHGNRYYESHRDIAEKASHYFKKYYNPRKMYLKSLNFTKKKSSKIIEIFIKSSHFETKASIALEMSSNSVVNFIKSSY